MKILKALFIGVVITLPVQAKDSKTPLKYTKLEGSEFNVDPKVAENIYQSLTKKNESSPLKQNDVSFEIGYMQLSPETAAFKNEQFTWDATSGVSSIPFVQIEMSAPVASLGGWVLFSGYGSFGYSTTQEIYEVQNSDGMSYRDSIELTWIPLRAGILSEWQEPILGVLKPGILLGAGYDLIEQRGSLDGSAQSYRVPSWFVGGSLHLWPSTKAGEPAFNGVTARLAKRTTFGSEQKINGWQGDLGVGFIF